MTKTTPSYVPVKPKSIKTAVLSCYTIQFTGTNLIRLICSMKIRESTGIQCMFMICEHKAGQNHNIKTAKISSERVAKFQYVYFGTTLTNQSSMHKDIMNRLN
jgi:hypothetical protein